MSIWLKHRVKIQVAVVLLCVFTAGFAMGAVTHPGYAQEPAAIGDVDAAFDPMWEVYNLIKTRYVDRDLVEVPKLVDGAIKGMVDSLGDQFSAYMDPEDYTLFQSELSGDVEGIGVVINTDKDTGDIVVVTVLDGAAAKEAGVLPGDIFWEVNGEKVTGLNQTELAGLVRGPAGTEVTITFKRGEEFVEITMTRVHFQVPNVTSKILDSDIAYISMAQFSAQSRAQVDQALKDVDINNRKGLIFDLRGDPGGLLTSAIDMGSLFIKDGVLVYEAFGDGTEQTYEANGNYGNITVPIVVLVDEGSASASELLAGALKDTGVATLIGEKTFGKGTVQNIQPLSNNGGIRLTIARWLTPKRSWIHELGITPDIVVEWNPKTPEELAAPDPQLQAAVDFLTKK